MTKAPECDCADCKQSDKARVERVQDRDLRATLVEAMEALRPLAKALEGWHWALDSERDIGRMNYDTGITWKHVETAAAVLTKLEELLK